LAVSTAIASAVAELAAGLTARGWRLASAESCTGGLIAAACTDRAGSSDWFERGFVSYSNAAKTDMLGVAAALIDSQGAVSEAVAIAMARGALQHSAADLAVAVTGIAGPGGGSADKPVGTVWLAWAGRAEQARVWVRAEQHRFAGDRGQVRSATVLRALAGLCEVLR
jgi:nicotinamide-nucleotide amidase